jgi:hypothetical protein
MAEDNAKGPAYPSERVSAEDMGEEVENWWVSGPAYPFERVSEEDMGEEVENWWESDEVAVDDAIMVLSQAADRWRCVGRGVVFIEDEAGRTTTGDLLSVVREAKDLELRGASVTIPLARAEYDKYLQSLDPETRQARNLELENDKRFIWTGNHFEARPPDAHGLQTGQEHRGEPIMARLAEANLNAANTSKGEGQEQQAEQKQDTVRDKINAWMQSICFRRAAQETGYNGAEGSVSRASTEALAQKYAGQERDAMAQLRTHQPNTAMQQAPKQESRGMAR